MSRKDPLWSVVKVLPTDYAGYGGEVPEGKKAGDCSSGCRWAAYLEQSGDWLVCTKPNAPRFGLLTWKHQAGEGCFEWGCSSCLKSADDCKCPPEADLENSPSRCWFCRKGRREVAKLLLAESPPGKAPCAICNECVGLCYDLIAGETGPTSSHTLRPEQHAALMAWAKKLDDKRVAHQMQLEEPDGIVAVSAELLAVMAVAQELRDRLRPAATPTTWGWSTDSDPEYWFIGEDGEGFRSREAALAAARAADDFDWADELWLTTGARLRPSSTVPSCDTIDVAQWMEDFVADNYGGDYAEGWPEITPVAEVVFDELVEAWADRWLKPLPWRATGKPERVKWSDDAGKSECAIHGPPPALPRCPRLPCRPKPCSMCIARSTLDHSIACDMCGGTGQTCATHARSWSFCADERDKP